MKRALSMAWILAPMLVAATVARADDEQSDDLGESPTDPDESGSEADESGTEESEPQTYIPPMGNGMEPGSMGHTSSMKSNPAIDEIKQAHGGEAPTHSPKATSGRTDLTAARDQLFRAFAKRSAIADCSMAEGIADDPVADFVWLVDHIAMPPWVGMRAADCLITDFAADATAGTAFERWVVDPGSKGVGLLLLDRIDDLPEDLAVTLSRTAVLEGPDAKEAKKRIKDSDRESVRKAYK